MLCDTLAQRMMGKGITSLEPQQLVDMVRPGLTPGPRRQPSGFQLRIAHAFPPTGSLKLLAVEPVGPTRMRTLHCVECSAAAWGQQGVKM